MAKRAHDLFPGVVFISDKIQITVVEIKDGSIDVLVVKPGKSGVMKNWDNDKFLKKTKDLVIAPMTMENGLKQTGYSYNDKKPNIKDRDLSIQGVIIKEEDILLKMHPVRPNDHGVSDFFVFAVNAKEQKMLVGTSPSDNNPMWVDAQTLLQLIPEEHMLSISTESFDATSFEDLKDKATNIFKKLKKKV